MPWEAKVRQSTKSRYLLYIPWSQPLIVAGSGLFQPLGAVLFNEDSYVETAKLVELTGVPYANYTPGERWAFDWKSGEAEIIPPAPQEFADLVAEEYQRYSQFWNDVYLPFSEIGYKV